MKLKAVVWAGDSYKALQAFPADALREAGFELWNVQRGVPPGDFKPMPEIGTGVEELRIWVESGTYRLIYIARLAEAVYVLHAFQKKSQQTNQKDVELARSRLRQIMQRRR